MVSSINSLLGAWYSQSSTETGVGAGLLTAWARAKAGVGASASALTQDPNAPLAPVWQPGISPNAEALVQRALASRAFFDTEAKLYSDLGATGDYKRLFALHSGLSTLHALAGASENTGLSKAQLAQLQAQFTRGLTELESFFAKQNFEAVRLAQTDRVDSAQTSLALPVQSEDYVTGIIHRGGLYDRISGLDANAKFEIVATSLGGTERRVAIDLSQMGSIPRSLSNVISHINVKLAAAGAASRLEAVDQTPKVNTVVLAGRPVETRYTGPKQYALKVDVRANEKVAFAAVDGAPAFYALGSALGGPRLIKLEDVAGASGLPQWLTRPDATLDPIGAYVADGWPAGAGAFEQRSNALLSVGPNNFEDLLSNAGEAVLKLQLGDGRVLSVSTAWRTGDQEQWRALAGQDEDAALMGDLAERLTQLLHEQGVAASVGAWEDGGDHGLSIFTNDLVSVSSLSIGGRAARFETIDPPGMVGGLRDGVFARRFETGPVAADSDLFVGEQSFIVTTSSGTHTIKIDGGEDGLDAATLAAQLNEKLRANNISAAAFLDESGGVVSLRIDALHDTLAVTARLNEESYSAALQAPGAWAQGGLPQAASGQPFGDAIRAYSAAQTALATHTGALDIAIIVATGAGERTVNLTITAGERAANPDLAPGQWSAALQARLDEALNAAGVYVSGSDDLASWRVAEGAGQRLVSVTVNGDALTLSADAPAFGVGGAFAADRSFTSANAAGAVDDVIAAFTGDQTVSVTFETVWGARTVSASLQPGDPHTLESAALRLNEALAAQGYDLGVAAVALSGGGAGLRIVTGASNTVRGVGAVSLGGIDHAATLDPIDAATHGANAPGAARAADRAARGAAITETIPGASSFTAPSNGVSGWFPGRAFDVAIGGGAKVATAQAVAAGPDGAVYVLADLSGDSATSAIKGVRDVALLKYDSAGKLVFTQMLGAAQSASGFALAVSADGKVAVAGAVEGALTGAGGERGGLDSFVAVYDAKGAELWTQRRGASGADQANAVAFASDGSVIIAGQTDSALGPALALGAADAYVRGFSADGRELFVRQFGSGGADSATALLVRDAPGGSFEIFTGGVESSRGVIRAFSFAADTGFAQGASRDIGLFHGGAINALASDGGALYVAGAVGADRLALGQPAQAAVAGQDGFVARISFDLGSTALDRATYLGSSKDDQVKSLAVVDGVIYAAGNAGSVMAGQGGANVNSAFLARLNDEGEIDWSRSFSSANGGLTLSSLAVQPSGACPLDALGLPAGAIAATASTPLVARSALRVGDEFQIGVDGRRLTTIRISATDTLASVLTSTKRAVGAGGRAEIVRENGVERIKITAFDGRALRLAPGRADRNALAGLGLSEGIVAVNSKARGAVKTFGLGLTAADLRLDTKEAIAATKAELSAAISMVRQIYETLLNPNAQEQTAEEKALEQRRQSAGAAPQYYTQQLANYQAALARLSGG